MILETIDVRLDRPSRNDVARRLPAGGCDLEHLQLHADGGAWLLIEVESPGDDAWDEEADDFVPRDGRLLATYRDASGRRWRLAGRPTRDRARRLCEQFLTAE